MNSTETLALWRQGKAAWQDWAQKTAEKRQALEKAGKWAVDWYGEGQNDETKAWLEEATADFCEAAFENGADFSGVQFPGPADFDRARFGAATSFSGARFSGNFTAQHAEFLATDFSGARFQGFANFDRARFGADVTFDKAQFLKECEMEPCARFQRAQFSANADFTAAHFAGSVQFLKAAFCAATFDKCEFTGDALFAATQFGAATTFVKARFAGAQVDFSKAHFRSDARFLETHFGGSWAGLVISGACSVNFSGAQFEGETSFRKSWLIGESEFKDAAFKGLVRFDGALFVMPANFAPTEFSASASMRDAQFVREANFSDARFLADCDFGGAKFGPETRFQGTHFTGPANFAGAEFSGAASFRGATAEAAFTIDGARYVVELDFAEMTAPEPLALGKLVKFKPKHGWFSWLKRRKGEPPFLSRWTRAAPGGGDMEYRTPPPPDTDEPDVIDAPVLPAEKLSTSAAAKLAAAAAAGTEESNSPGAGDNASSQEATVASPSTSEEQESADKDTSSENKSSTPFRVLPFGRKRASVTTPVASTPQPAQNEVRARRRSMLRPAVVWLISIVLFTPLYLGQRPDSHANGEPWRPANWSSSMSWEGAPAWLSASVGSVWNGVSGAFATGPCVTGQSDAAGEALFLSAKNALVFVPWENEHVIQRSYGCLYGLEGAAPNIPLKVSLFSLMQAALSFVLLAMTFVALGDRLKRR